MGYTIRAIAGVLTAWVATLSPATAGQSPDLHPDSAALECRFQVTGHSAVPSAVDSDGEWIASQERGYQYLQIEDTGIRPFPASITDGATEDPPWFYQRVDFSILSEHNAPSADSAYTAERMYLRFNETGGYDSLLLVHEHRNGSWHASLFEANATRAMDPDMPGFSGFIRHGRGRCAALDSPESLSANSQ